MVLFTPDPNAICVICSGDAVITDVTRPDRSTLLDFEPITDAVAVKERKMIVFAGFTKLMAFDGSNVAMWETSRIAWELAERMQVKRELIDYYERRSPNPALDFIERAAAALEVSVAELLGSQPNSARSKPGPQSQLQRKFEQVKLLPREKQKFVLQFLDTVLESNQQKA